MALKPEPLPENVGRGTRLRLGSRVLVAGVLFALVALLVTRLAERSLVRVRLDWTSSGENTLDPASLDLVGRLPEDVTIDVFFRSAEFPLEELAIQVQERVRRLLYVLRDSSNGRVNLVVHDLNAGRIDERSQARLFELGAREVQPGGLLAVSAGKRHALLELRGDLADFDLGDPTGARGAVVPARLVSFRGEEALISALMKVARGDAPRLLFTRGHGEYELDSAAVQGLASLKTALEADGFTTGLWDPAKEPEVPDDCRVLATIGPEQPFAPAELAALRRFVERGGRLLAAPGIQPLPKQDSLADLLRPWGLEVAPNGLVARGQPSVSGERQYGTNACAVLWIDPTAMSQHEVTEPLRRSQRSVVLNGARALAVGHGLPGSTVLQVLRSSADAWLDLPPAGAAVGDWQPDAAAERHGPFVLAAAIVFPPVLAAGPTLRSAGDQRPESRVFVIGAAAAAINASFDTNRDFLLNAFNWCASREWRANVRARERTEHRLDLQDPQAIGRVHLWLVVVLPLLSLAAGLFTAWRRRK